MNSPSHGAPAPVIAPYGSWSSPLSAQALAAGGINFSDLRSVAGRLYWTENVPAAGGSIALFGIQAGTHGGCADYRAGEQRAHARA